MIHHRQASRIDEKNSRCTFGKISLISCFRSAETDETTTGVRYQTQRLNSGKNLSKIAPTA